MTYCKRTTRFIGCSFLLLYPYFAQSFQHVVLIDDQGDMVTMGNSLLEKSYSGWNSATIIKINDQNNINQIMQNNGFDNTTNIHFIGHGCNNYYQNYIADSSQKINLISQIIGTIVNNQGQNTVIRDIKLHVCYGHTIIYDPQHNQFSWSQTLFNALDNNTNVGNTRLNIYSSNHPNLNSNNNQTVHIDIQNCNNAEFFQKQAMMSTASGNDINVTTYPQFNVYQLNQHYDSYPAQLDLLYQHIINLNQQPVTFSYSDFLTNFIGLLSQGNCFVKNINNQWILDVVNP
ncbi:hypothetical protein [Cysteiniphilum litorale]|uniref:hypothetical protein n=1 Tax=Cysteiniphilum litorale TaxID=2056700 RepID=UPI003F880330